MSQLGTNPKDLIGVKKLRLDLIPAAAERAEAHVLALGAQKYGEWNWRQNKVNASIYVAAARRHLLDWFAGIDNDHESGVSHLGHVRACMAILLDAEATGNLIDDRPTLLERRQRKDPPHQPAPETVVCQDWHRAVREIRTGTPNSAMSAVIAPTPSTPGWMDKAAETLAEKRIDSVDEIYQWGGGRWQISNDKTFCWNARECAWNESTTTPQQLRQDGTRVNI